MLPGICMQYCNLFHCLRKLTCPACTTQAACMYMCIHSPISACLRKSIFSAYHQPPQFTLSRNSLHLCHFVNCCQPQSLSTQHMCTAPSWQSLHLQLLLAPLHRRHRCAPTFPSNPMCVSLDAAAPQLHIYTEWQKCVCAISC